MIVAESTELTSMAGTMRTVMTTKSPLRRVAEVADGDEPFDRDLWSVLSEDLGVTGILVPEAYGGLGLGWGEARIVLSELGRGLACVPFLSSAIVASSILVASEDTEAMQDVLPGVADGSIVAAPALGDEGVLGDEPVSGVETSPDGARWRLTGVCQFVADGPSATVFLVLARHSDSSHQWFLVDREASGLSNDPLPVVDTTRPQSAVTLASAPARPIGHRANAAVLLTPALDAALTGLACEQSAASQFLLSTTVDYVSQRYQFGQPIGSFQGLQHRLADLSLLVDESVSASQYATWAAAEQPGLMTQAASIAGLVCAESLHTAALETIQMHGGIGFTWEHLAHRYYRRAMGSVPQYGKPSRLRERLLHAISV